MDRLLKIGFKKVGSWKLVDSKPEFELTTMFDTKNVLYAFVSDGQIKYIGKTTRPFKKRMYHYQNPGPTQSTNINNNRRIAEQMSEGYPVDILALADNGMFRYANFHINLAAGLEDNLVAELNPEWNKTGTNKMSSTSKAGVTSTPCGDPKNGPGNAPVTPSKKYHALKEYLSSKLKGEPVTLSYGEIETIIATKLPNSAYKHKEWWANGGHSHAQAWLEAGWKVSKVLLGKNIQFCPERLTNGISD